MSRRLSISIQCVIDRSDASPADKQLAKEEAACHLKAADEDLAAGRIPQLVRDGLADVIEERLVALERRGVVEQFTDDAGVVRWRAARRALGRRTR